MNELSLPRRFVKVWRNFGLAVAIRVTYSKIRGLLYPALALPDGRAYDDRARQLSFLVNAADHVPALLDELVALVAVHDAGDWEICICERPPLEADMTRLLEHLRGTRPWLRIVSIQATVGGKTAAQWTVEQATGRFIALVAPGWVPDATSIQKLLEQMRLDTKVDAAVLIGAGGSDCRLAMQRKSGYLAAQPERWPLSAAALARQLDEAKVPTAYVQAA